MAAKEKPPAPQARAPRPPRKTAAKPAEKPSAEGSAAPEGERIAKVLSRRGVASRREAERLIAAGEVTVNGKTITSPALNVTDKDRITVSGKALPEREPARLWLYYKPEGLVTSAADEKGRDTVFDHLPPDLPRVMSVGRLDLNSEGLLLLTNDGELKRRLELPSTGWLRKYRVRINGTPTDPDLEPLRRGITVDGERFLPMTVVLDRVQGANAWLTIGLREGKNREIRRALSALDLYVNRLIRVSYGPFRLNDLQPGEVEEVKPRVIREQLGEAYAEADEAVKTAARASGRTAGRSVTTTSKRTTAKPESRPGADPAKPAKPAPRAAKPTTKPTTKPSNKPAPDLAPGEGLSRLSRTFRKSLKPAAFSGVDTADPARKPRSPKPPTKRPPRQRS